MADASSILFRDLGVEDYVTTWQAMQQFTDSRSESSGDEIWFQTFSDGASEYPSDAVIGPAL